MAAELQIDYKQVTFTCSCGANYSVGSTIKGDTHVDICSNCHPFYTKKQKLVDTAGRVERFKQKYAMASPKKKANKTENKKDES